MSGTGAGENTVSARLQALFGYVWQAALDHAGIISRRRARDFGAGDDVPESVVALVEFLERVPPTEWPPRWRGWGKLTACCPTLRTERLEAGLVDGKMRRTDAVLVWDMERDPATERLMYTNMAIGYLPRNAFAGLPRDHHERTAWRNWTKQWANFHGLPVVSGFLHNENASPEGILASWIYRQQMAPAEVEVARREMRRWIVDYSDALVDRMVTAIAEHHDNDDAD